MESKVMLMIFGVVLLLAAIFFFFKSFASHEQRMQEEQRLRVQMEREKLERERAKAGRKLTPEEIAQKRRLAEARKKAEEARRLAAQVARKEAEQKRLQEQIEAAKRHAEREKVRLAEMKAAEELRKKEAAKKAEEAKRLAAEALKAERASLLKTCGELLTSLDQAAQAVRAALAGSEDAERNVENQRKAAKTRIQVMTRQLEAKQRLVDSIPVDNRWVCPNLICNKYRPTPVKSTSTRTCPYCKTPLQEKDWNEKRRKAAADDLNKTRRMLALEQQRAMNIRPAAGQGNAATYRARSVTLQNTRRLILTAKQKAEGEAPDIPLLKQQLAQARRTVDGVVRSLPQDLSRLASTAATRVKAPAPKKKIYKLKDGRTLEVSSVMMAGDDVILKTADGKMVTVKKADIESSGVSDK